MLSNLAYWDLNTGFDQLYIRLSEGVRDVLEHILVGVYLQLTIIQETTAKNEDKQLINKQTKRIFNCLRDSRRLPTEACCHFIHQCKFLFTTRWQ